MPTFRADQAFLVDWPHEFASNASLAQPVNGVLTQNYDPDAGRLNAVIR